MKRKPEGNRACAILSRERYKNDDLTTMAYFSCFSRFLFPFFTFIPAGDAGRRDPDNLRIDASYAELPCDGKATSPGTILINLQSCSIRAMCALKNFNFSYQTCHRLMTRLPMITTFKPRKERHKVAADRSRLRQIFHLRLTRPAGVIERGGEGRS